MSRQMGWLFVVAAVVLQSAGIHCDRRSEADAPQELNTKNFVLRNKGYVPPDSLDTEGDSALPLNRSSWRKIDLNDSLIGTIRSIAVSDSMFVATAWSSFLTSADGRHWTRDSAEQAISVTWNGEAFYIFSSPMTRLHISAGGRAWEEHRVNSSASVWYVEWVGDMFAALTEGMGNQAHLVSKDGIDWESVGGYRQGTLHAVLKTDSVYFGVGAGIRKTTNGKDWTVVFEDSCLMLYALATNAKTLVAVGPQGAIVVSNDRDHWTRIPLGIRCELRAVVWTGERFVAVGATKGFALILSSTDGYSWATEYHGEAGLLLDVACRNDTCIAVGGNGQILVSSPPNR